MENIVEAEDEELVRERLERQHADPGVCAHRQMVDWQFDTDSLDRSPVAVRVLSYATYAALAARTRTCTRGMHM